jgi:protein involved in polysaccharide export with SLBB domain
MPGPFTSPIDDIDNDDDQTSPTTTIPAVVGKERVVRLGNVLNLLRRPAGAARAVAAPAAMLGALLALGGCNGFLDPTEMMRWRGKERLLVPVLPSLAEGMDEAEPEFANAEDVKQADLIPSNADYVIGSNDLLSISLTEVSGPGVESVKTTRVSQSGPISLPLLGTIKAAGMTEAELERAIVDAYRNRNLIQNAQVSVTVIEARQRTFSILGAVARGGQYQIVQNDFRLLDALTLAGDVVVQGIEYAYIVRKEDKSGATTRPATTTQPTGEQPVQPKTRPVDPLEGKQGRGGTVLPEHFALAPLAYPVHLMMLQDAPTQPARPADEGGRKVLIDGKWVPVGGAPAQPGAAQPAETPAAAPTGAGQTPTPPAAQPNTPATGAGEPARTAPVDTLAPAKPTPAAEPAVPTPAPTPAAAEPGTGAAPSGTSGTGSDFAFDAPKADADTRIIRVPLEGLQRGELQYNVVIRPNDTILIPNPKVGEYYMGGHVQRSGVYSLTGRQITLKQAIISAGMLDPLAWPERTEVIRRVGKDREMFVRVNLPKIFAGEQSDIYLRPYDTVNVGSNALAPFLAAIRGSFRFTYGFGFIYDRNYAPQQTLQ